MSNVGTNLQKFFPILHVISSTFILFLERSSKEKSNFILRLPRFKSLLSSMINTLSQGWWIWVGGRQKKSTKPKIPQEIA